jgi:phosphoglycolate phosphatase
MNFKLYLFDIDGTLVHTHGIPRRAMRTVLTNRFVNFKYDDQFNYSGRTDWEIIEHLLGFDHREFTNDLVHELLDDFLLELENQLKNGKKPFIYPGVKELLGILSKLKHIFLGLVTGNIEGGAKLKLNAAGLAHHFPIGGFGNDSKNRNDLPPIAIHRAYEYYDVHIKRENIWIIGDSIHDVFCAQKNNLRCLAVSTGWTHYDELKAVNPEYLVKDLSDTESILRILVES